MSSPVAKETVESAIGIAHVETNIGIDEIASEKVDTRNHDDALDIFDGDAESFEYTQKEANWVCWKIDLILLPMVSNSDLDV